MKRKMELEDLKDFYRTDDIREGAECYEYVDKATGIIFGLPQEFQVFIDGSLFDPIKMLKIPPYIWSLVFDDEIFPLEASYLCGHYSAVSEPKAEIRFWPGDPMDEVLRKMDAVLVKAHWDLREGVSDTGWSERSFGGRLIWSSRKTDRYETSGDWYWLLGMKSVGASNWMYFGETILFAQYVRTLRPVYALANERLGQFERERAFYQEKIVGCLNALPGRVHWIMAADEEELWPKYDANRELWEKAEYDWQIILFEDYLEIRSRGGSPGVISLDHLRYDDVGYQICQELSV